MVRFVHILSLAVLFLIVRSAHLPRPASKNGQVLATVMRQDYDEYHDDDHYGDMGDEDFSAGDEEEFPDFDSNFDEGKYEEDILKDTAVASSPKSPPQPSQTKKSIPSKPAKDKKPAYKVSKGEQKLSSNPESCACKKGPKSPNSVCWFITDEKNKYCKSRQCAASYICVKPGAGTTRCMRKKNTKKIVNVRGNICKIIPIDEFAYVPYAA